MKAIVFDKNIPRYVVMKLLGARRAARTSTARWSVLSPVSLRDIPQKPLPTPEWVRVSPILSGICGSDLSVLSAKGSPYFSPLTSTPFVLGHEVVGNVTEMGAEVKACESAEGLQSLSVGDRVVLEPALGCRVRGIKAPCPSCAAGRSALCRNITRGDISPGIQTGYCKDTGGGWSASFVAHRNQLHHVPETISNTAAVLAEPLACVLHGVLRVRLHKDQTVFVMGCGTIGLLTVAALRAREFTGTIVAVAKHAHQKEHVRRLGADTILGGPKATRSRPRYAGWADVLDAELHYPEIGKPTVVGGADVTFDCVASSQSLDDCVRFTTAGGSMVLLGMPGVPSNIDWTPLWYKEISLYATYAYGIESQNGSVQADGSPAHTYRLALDMLETWGLRLEPLVSEPYELDDYRRAVRSAFMTGRSGNVKTVFRISE